MGIEHGKYLGVDYGDKRTGLASCDLFGMIAEGIGTVEAGGMRNTAEAVAKKARELSCKKIVVGLPKNMDGTEGESAQNARAFADLLTEKTGVKTIMVDERSTTVMAHGFLNDTNTRGKKRKAVVDSVAAVVILQSYIDSLK